MSDSHPNIKENFFQYATLTKISGDPTYASLAKLSRECKANGKSVPSTLGGGNQGHLGLVTSAIVYETLAPGTPFIRPALPVLPDLDDSTGPQIQEARHTFAESTKAYNLCNQVERSLLQMINSAIEDDCLSDLYDAETGLLEGTIPEIIQSLFGTYGTVTAEELAAAKTKVKALSYDHSKPIANIFLKINEYSIMAAHANAAETQQQMINLGLIIITRSTIFASDIREWHARPAAEKTWTIFKTHFQEAQKEIKKSQPDVTTDSLGYHNQANASTFHDQVV